jgi:signal transduction histidine kinase
MKHGQASSHWKSGGVLGNRDHEKTPAGGSDLNRAETFSVVSHRLLEYANLGLRKGDFVREASRLLIEYSECDEVEIRLIDHGKLSLFQYVPDANPPFSISVTPCTYDAAGNPALSADRGSDIDWLCREVAHGDSDRTSACYTSRGSFFTGDTGRALVLRPRSVSGTESRILRIGGEFKSLAIIRFLVVAKDVGVLMLKSRRQDSYTVDQVELYEEVAQILGIAMNFRRAQIALRERVKELTCLFGIAKISARPSVALEEVLRATVELLPPAWLYPDIASARIILDGSAYSTVGFREQFARLSADIIADNRKRGAVEVAYSEDTPELDEGPFLTEERNLIDAVAREISLIIERRQAEQDRESLHEQLRHADRLATIGQLAAGVAHELNEPLGSILGFAQLSKKSPGIPEEVKHDIDKIIAASLHGREVIMKLMIFARQAPPQKQSINLNRVVEDGLSFFESRCAKAGIELIRVIQPDIPEIVVDQSQMHQVLINLVVNAIQAMPEGGSLTIQTELSDGELCLSVEDTGTGMDESVIEKIFIPFFTTKDVNEGTGLGLSVVHGIATSHGGSVTVESKVGSGSRFTVRLPLNRPEKEEG